jgi:hypothetical protein
MSMTKNWSPARKIHSGGQTQMKNQEFPHPWRQGQWPHWKKKAKIKIVHRRSAPVPLGIFFIILYMLDETWFYLV